MRTTLNMDDELMRQTKQRAIERGVTLTALIEEALREHLRREGERAQAVWRLRLVTVGGAPRPGVDLDDRDALYERMEGR
ncbi:MAG TPA: ribbon-helix-helix protein, CopG family [Thermoanaerobaculia bacterium]|nr:ribbon-helix-helix protein, CopG family [Thermoanaerobaculia bacterium]